MGFATGGAKMATSQPAARRASRTYDKPGFGTTSHGADGRACTIHDSGDGFGRKNGGAANARGRYICTIIHAMG
jgi:hypothetical protein